jgi:uncharacterized membrane protein YfcA
MLILQKALLVFLPSIVAGIIHTTTGFGSGIIVMLFFPLFLSLLQASALSTIISLTNMLALTFSYRKYIKPKLIILPLMFYLVVSGVTISLVGKINVSGLKLYFGLFLIALAIHFIFFANKIKLNPNLPTVATCSTISGVASGLFGIGAPPMALYFLSVTDDDKNIYLGTSQLFFSITCLYTTGMRAVNGIFTIDLLPLVIPGVAGIMIGKGIGTRIVNRINIKFMKIIINIFLAFAGLLTVVTNV